MQTFDPALRLAPFRAYPTRPFAHRCTV